MPTPSISPADTQKLFAELTRIILFIDDEGYGLTSEQLVDIRDGFRQLEQECGKWQAQATLAKEQATAWELENEVLKEKLRLATDFCPVCGKHPPCEHVSNNSLSIQ